MSKKLNIIKIQNKIDYDKLAEAIVRAELKVDDELKAKKEAEHEKLQKEWDNTLGYDDNLKGCKKIGNTLKILWNIITFKKEKVLSSVANNALLRMILAVIYFIFEYLIYAISVVGFGLMIRSFVKGSFSWGFLILAIVFLMFFIARIVRMARFEVDYIEDKNYLATLFSAVTSFIAIVVSTVAIVISIIYKG